MHTFGSGRSTRWWLTAASLGSIVLLGCATPPRDPQPEDYVFFGNYPELRRIASPSGVFLYGNPSKPLRDHDQLIIERVRVVFQPESAYWIDPAKSEELADYFRSEIVASLSGKYRVVPSPAPGVLRVSVTLGDVRKRQPSAAGSATKHDYQPVLVLLITDPMTGEPVALLRDINRGHEFAAVVKTDEAAARALLTEWAKTLRAKLDQIQAAAGSGPASRR